MILLGPLRVEVKLHWGFSLLKQIVASLCMALSHSKKRPGNLVLGRMSDHHVYDLIEIGVENFKSLLSFSFDKKIAPHEGSKPFICFTGEGFENVQELKQLKEILTDLFRGKVGKIYIPDQKIGEMPLADKSKRLKRERREGRLLPKGSASKKKKESE